jgi:CRISPR-associated endonuclease/helicase Cas3
LTHHCLDVAAVTEALLSLPTWRRRLSRAAGRDLDRIDLARLCVLAFLHDVGKTSAGFQAKIRGEPPGGDLRHDERGHTRETVTLFSNRKVRDLAAPLLHMRQIAAWSDPNAGVWDLWFAAISHHGDPIIPDRIEPRWANLNHLWATRRGYDPALALADLGLASRAAYPDAFQDGHQLLPAQPAFVHAFAGLVSLADWIASNPDPEYFPYDHGDDDRAAFARARAGHVLKAMRIDMEDARADLLARAQQFESVFPFAARPMQSLMGDNGLGPVVIVEAETGSGKTEAALWRFKTLFEAGEVDSLAFVLPTRVAAVSLERRVRKAMAGMFPDERLRPNVVLAAPGYLRADGVDGRRDLLARFETLWPDWPEAREAHRRWAAENAKRYLAAGVAVGTIDQVLLSGLMTRHAHLRGAALMRSLLVVDEVHASDAYMTALLDVVLRRHAGLGGHALLLSATLGGAARTKLLAVGDERRGRPRGAGSEASDHLAQPYPAVSDRHGIQAVSASNRRKTVRIELVSQIDDPRWIAAVAVEAARKGARVLVMRNTVGAAVAVQRAIELEVAGDGDLLFRVAGVACPHHGRYAAEDRRLMDEAVETQFGKTAPRRTGLILVGTQTLEQSLDIDADLLVTDLAPADVFLQRIGRLHRHERTRPAGFLEARVIVLTPGDGSLDPFLKQGARTRHGMGSVYESLVSLEATWRDLKARPLISIPEDCRALVEAATDPEILYALAETLGGFWPKAYSESVGKFYAKQTAGIMHALQWRVEWDEITWPRTDETVRTRLGDDDRLLEWDAPWQSPFGFAISRLKVPAWMARGVGPDFIPTAVTESEDGTTWSAGGLAFAYDRFGLRRCG